MTEYQPLHSQLEDLLSQDSQVVSFPFDEFRMNLQASIQELEQKARKLQNAAYWGVAATIVCYLSVLPMEFFNLTGIPWIGPLWVVCGNLALWPTVILVSLYTFKYKPAIERARGDLQTTILAQLQSQVAELSRKIDAQAKP